MEAIKITKERLEEVLPENIKESDVLDDKTKKTLGAILNYFAILDKSKENGYVILSNTTLRESVGIRMNDLLNCIQTLIENNLIRRERGETRTANKPSVASKYYMCWNELKKPLKKKTFDDIFAQFYET